MGRFKINLIYFVVCLFMWFLFCSFVLLKLKNIESHGIFELLACVSWGAHGGGVGCYGL